MKTVSFNKIAKEILSNEKFCKLKNESHHGITRMDHTLRVSRNVYKVSKKLNLDYVSATRAALLHDFFTNKEFGINSGLIQGVVHPDIALSNARGEFQINDLEANAIEAHMFPLSTTVPKSREAWVLTLVDKMVAMYEYASYKFNVKKLSYGLAFIGILSFNIITMGKK